MYGSSFVGFLSFFLGRVLVLLLAPSKTIKLGRADITMTDHT